MTTRIGDAERKRRNIEVCHRSDTELAMLAREYTAWLKAEGLQRLGSADEHQFDEELTQAQRNWLRNFMDRWEGASVVWTNDGEAWQTRDLVDR